MKYLLSIIAFCFISICHSQNLTLEPTNKLIELKKNAVSASNYELAAKIKKEIELRNKIDSISKENEAQLGNAIAAENYKQAALLKSKKEQLTTFNEIPNKLKKALEDNDFKRADDLSKERQQLISILVDGKIPEQQAQATNSEKSIPNNTNTAVNSNPKSTSKLGIEQKPLEYFCVGFNATMIRFSSTTTGPKTYRYPTMFGLSISTGTFIKKSEKLKLVVGIDIKGFKAVANEATFLYDAGQKIASYVFSGYQIGMEYKLGNEKIEFYPGALLDLGITGTQKFMSSGNEVAIYKEQAFKRLNGQITAGIVYKTPKFSIYTKYRLGILNIEGKWNSGNQKTYLSNLEIGAYIPVKAKN